MEAWKNANDGVICIIKTDPNGKEFYEIIKGGKVFSITHDDRALNMERAASPDLDMFVNGSLVPATALDIDASGISEVDPFVGISVAEHAALDHTNQLGVFVHDSFITAVSIVPLTIGNEWIQINGLSPGPCNYDPLPGPDMVVCAECDAIDMINQGRYHLSINCQLTNPTADGWFEAAVEPNGLALSDWPTDIAQGHVGTWIPMAAAAYPDINLGFATSISVQVLAGGSVAGWVRYMTEHGGDATPTGTIDVMTVLYAQRITT